MPLYEYECVTCGHRTEVIQRVGAPPIGACSECGGEMKRLLSAPAFQFKGSGWYVTDYAKKDRSGKEGASAKAVGGESGDKQSSTESSGGSGASGSAGSSKPDD